MPLKCADVNCSGQVESGICSVCGSVHSAGDPASEFKGTEALNLDAKIRAVRKLLEPGEIGPSREDLLAAAEQVRSIQPYNFEAWRLHADLLLTALQQLQTRQMQSDASFSLMKIPLRENDLRDAAEWALRQCAQFADSAEKAITLVDEANRVRRLTWF